MCNGPALQTFCQQNGSVHPAQNETIEFALPPELGAKIRRLLANPKSKVKTENGTV